MLIRKADREARSKDELTIESIFNESEASLAFAKLDGKHDLTRNSHSARAYIFTAGSASVTVGDEVHEVQPHDVVYIPKGVWHRLEGKAEYYVLNSPPYDRSQEEKS